MTDGALLLRAILADPADDAPRLIYADWLDEQGHASRAHFIRVSIAVHRKEPGANEFKHAIDLAGMNLDDLSWAGAAHDRKWHEGGLSNAEWDRAFVSAIHCPIDTFLSRAKSIFQTQPITNVFLSDRQPHQETGYWGWTHEIENDSSGTPGEVPTHSIPSCLMVPYLLASRESQFSRQGAFYLSPELALAALSNACVAYGRRVAELPPLVPVG